MLITVYKASPISRHHSIYYSTASTAYFLTFFHQIPVITIMTAPGEDHFPIEGRSNVCLQERQSVKQYVATRIPTLKPPLNPVPNPFKTIFLLNKQQWAFFAVSLPPRITVYRLIHLGRFLGLDMGCLGLFYCLSDNNRSCRDFNKSITDTTWGLTLVLMLRSAGAITFGIASDRWGRKWPFVANLVLFSVFELATGFARTFQQFLACRALFGIAMGGLYGNAVATALEDCPTEARRIMSGILQVGYVFGYLLATVFSRALVNTTSHGWRPTLLVFRWSANPDYNWPFIPSRDESFPRANAYEMNLEIKPPQHLSRRERMLLEIMDLSLSICFFLRQESTSW